MALTFPLDVQDAAYPASLDRLQLKALGMQAGVVEENDFKVTAGAGLQVNVASGHSYINQTGAKEGEFYNGLYYVANDATTNPANSVVVSSVYPQLAQIILRVYDVTELGISGSSYAKLEWLNGTPTEGATKENRKGAAELPQSSFRIADVLVPKNAVSSASFEIGDRRTWAEGGQEVKNYSVRAGGSVSTAKIANEAVTSAKMAPTIGLVPAGAITLTEAWQTCATLTITPSVASKLMVIATFDVAGVGGAASNVSCRVALDGGISRDSTLLATAGSSSLTMVGTVLALFNLSAAEHTITMEAQSSGFGASVRNSESQMLYLLVAG